MADNYQNQNMFLDWDDAIENDGQEFVTLEEGDYNFTVTGFERGRSPAARRSPPATRQPSLCRSRPRTASPSSTPTCCCTAPWSGASPPSSAASARRSTASAWSWTGTAWSAAAAAPISSPARTPTVMATNARPMTSTASMTGTRSTSPWRNQMAELSGNDDELPFD